jgi:GNAT superfamily N-acetyltransferase
VQTEFRTKRLRLLALNLRQLGLYLDDPGQLEAELGLLVSHDNLTPLLERAIGMKRAKMAGVHTELHPWYTYWLLVVDARPRTEEPFGAGQAGFKGEPGPDGEVEIGYGIDPAYRRQGYTTETVRALVAWAFAAPACRAVIAPVRKDNPASSRVLAKAGFLVSRETAGTLHWRIERPRPT